MAAAVNPLKSLREEATCSICLSFFKDPVSLDCGHNFCQACITQCWEGPNTDTCCPQCRETFPQRTLRPNRQLGNFVEIAKQLSFQTAAAAGGGDLCKVHQEPFKLFCNQDQMLICVICRESQAHRAHRVVPTEEAAGEHKEQIQTRLNTLKQEREELLEWKQDGEKQSQEYLGKIEAERQKIVSEFEQLRQLLEEQEQLLLAQLEELDKEIVKIQDENVTKLSEEISRLSDLISEIEEKCQQPTSEFLQDIKSTWSRCEKVKFEKPMAVPQDVSERVGISSQRNVCLQEALKKFKETLPYQLNFLISKAEKEAPPARARDRGRRPRSPLPRIHRIRAAAPALEQSLGGAPSMGQTTNISPLFLQVQATPDPDLGIPCSVVSTDKSVIQKYQNMGYVGTQNRFHPAACVLGYKGFTSGRCYWQVEVGNKRNWVLGIAKESVIHKGAKSRTPEKGIWALQSTGNGYSALTSPETALALPCSPSNIGVYLDYEGEKVTFYNVTSSGREPIFTFTSSFTGKIIPFFGSRRVEFLQKEKDYLWHLRD
ncbi:zinc finger protein RFP-like isoform X1 [Chelonia mydas]|uniref:zinc finger protein RFP-like isoform X1 n=1 Tax=Chelonia mydas TaxID=8469 RepID=UPI001CA807F6|nr:zinc finger protein RFP-like isoform X1 [Chelonia mydas]